MSSPESNTSIKEVKPLLSNEKLEAALAAGALDAVRENQRFGLPVISMQDGQIVYLDPFEAEAELLKSFPELATQQPSRLAAAKAQN